MGGAVSPRDFAGQRVVELPVDLPVGLVHLADAAPAHSRAGVLACDRMSMESPLSKMTALKFTIEG